MELTDHQQQRRAEFRDFADTSVAPFANLWDRQECLPRDVIALTASKGYLGAVVGQGHVSGGLDMIEFGLLNEELGRGCSSLRTLLTVHSMVALSILRWGSKELKGAWLSQLERGEVIGAFALTEAEAGSDARAIETQAVTAGDDFVLTGHKKWISLAQVAGLFLIFAKGSQGACAFLVERNAPGLTISPVRGLLGTRASMMGELHLDHCRVPRGNLVGAPGFGLSHIASSALDCGRYSVAWGCVGIAQACVEACVEYTGRRKQFGALLKDHQLVQRMITQMIVETKAARLLCWNAGRLKDAGDPASVVETSAAKYFACKTAAKAARDAVQLHGAVGCINEYAPERLFRDAKLMEIIEGSNELQEITIAQNARAEFSVSPAAASALTDKKI
ncbi:MAG TPA: acyl-CoA dehydrogenase family protein [Candidatus Angelobacter sp.]